jgi:hypothetical protein
MAQTIRQLWQPSKDDVERALLSFAPYLDQGELLSGAPSVTPDSPDITITNETINSKSVKVCGQLAQPGQVAMFNYAGQKAGQNYQLRVTVGTTAGRIKVVDQLVRVWPE